MKKKWKIKNRVLQIEKLYFLYCSVLATFFGFAVQR
jgi:hypothetical protein